MKLAPPILQIIYSPSSFNGGIHPEKWIVGDTIVV
jgi:hypothetical protein